ncbi:MAG: hypothetical protein QM598_12405 [Protaetiibacter sp.]
MRRPLMIGATALAAALALSGCVIAPAPSPTTTTLNGGDGGGGTGDDGGDGGGGDPFPYDYPTSLDGWKARYKNLPWLADDLDNDDYFITGTADGHDVMGFLCGYDGNTNGWAYGTDGTYVTVNFQSDVDVDVDAMRGDPYLIFTGIGTYALPADPQGTHVVVPSFDVSIEVDSTPGKERSNPTTAAVSFEFLGMPIPDTDTCSREEHELLTWITSEVGY